MAKGLAHIARSKKSITLEKDLETIARRIQAKLIEQTDKSWSLSTVLNILVAVGLQQTKKMDKAQWCKIMDGVKNKTIDYDDSMVTAFVKKIESV